MTENLWNVETECQHSSHYPSKGNYQNYCYRRGEGRWCGSSAGAGHVWSETRCGGRGSQWRACRDNINMLQLLHHQYLWPPSAAMVPAIAPPAAPAWSEGRVRDSLEKTWHQTRIVKEIQTRDWSSKASSYDCHCSTHAKLELSFKQFDLRELVR